LTFRERQAYGALYRSTTLGVGSGYPRAGSSRGRNPKMSHDEVDCITRAVALYEGVLDGAACHHRPGPQSQSVVDAETEVREVLPLLLGWLSDEARALIRDHLDHTTELVAFVHRVGAVSAPAPH
jgi:hypothetical protein